MKIRHSFLVFAALAAIATPLSAQTSTWLLTAGDSWNTTDSSWLTAPSGYTLKSFRLVQTPALSSKGFLRVEISQPSIASFPRAQTNDSLFVTAARELFCGFFLGSEREGVVQTPGHDDGCDEC